MFQRRILDRIDQHIAQSNEHMVRGNEHMARGNEHMARGNELAAKTNELMIENREAFQDLRIALREMNRRGEKLMGEMIAELQSQRAEHREESQAQRKALFAILDQLRGDNGAATSG